MACVPVVITGDEFGIKSIAENIMESVDFLIFNDGQSHGAPVAQFYDLSRIRT